MKFECNSQDLQKSIAIVEKAISSRSSLPVLENLYVEIKEGQLKLRGNDLEIGIENVIPIQNVEKEGAILVKAKTLSSIVSKLDNQTISIEVDEKGMFVLRGKKVDLDILGSHTNDYPVFPSVEKGVSLTLTADDLKDMIRHTIFSVSHDETKQFLNGILVKNIQDKLVFVATDGFRLAKKQMVIAPLEKEFSVIVPFKAVNELYRILQNVSNDTTVELNLSENQVAFRMNDFLLISRVIMGHFPDYNQVIPQSSQHEYLVSRKELLSACERASVIAASSSNIVRLSFTKDTLTILANTPGLGDFKEDVEISCEKGEEPRKIAFNNRLVLDVIKNLEGEKVTFSFNNELSPCKVEEASNEDFVYIIMPIRTSDFQG